MGTDCCFIKMRQRINFRIWKFAFKSSRLTKETKQVKTKSRLFKKILTTFYTVKQ